MTGRAETCVRKLFGRAKLTFYPRMHECEEDVEASRVIGSGILRFCEEYEGEILSIYGDALEVIRSQAHTVDVVVAGPSLVEDGPAAVLEPQICADGLRRHVILLFSRPLAGLAGAFTHSHPDEDVDDVILLSLGLIFFLQVHAYAETDSALLAERCEELGAELGTELGSWIAEHFTAQGGP